MSTAGPNFPTSVTGTTGAGVRNWTNPTNVEAADGSSATVIFLTTASVSKDLVCEGFGFAVPSTATINGITLEVSQGSQNNSINDNNVQLLKAGTPTGTNMAFATWSSGGPFIATYGGSTSLWGTSWTPTDINSATFGAVINIASTAGTSDTAACDFVRITVAYTNVVNGNFNATGMASTTALGTVSPKGTAVFSAVGQASVTHLGTPTFTGTAFVSPAGAVTTSVLGHPIVGISVLPAGVQTASALGTVLVKVFAQPTGLASVASLGQVRIDAVIAVTGLQATALLGTVIDTLKANPAGLLTTSHLGTITLDVRSRPPVIIWIN